jgi:hypothetical protein
MNMTSAIIEYRRHLKRRSFSSHTVINYMSIHEQHQAVRVMAGHPC